LFLGASPVAGFGIEADEFKRHCKDKGVTLNTIEEAFSSCKPKPPVPPAVIEAQRVGATQLQQQKHKKNSIPGGVAQARSPFKV
jgi:DNA-binding transcriptional MerR regulator